MRKKSPLRRARPPRAALAAPFAIVVGLVGCGADPGDASTDESEQALTFADAGGGLGSAVVTCSALTVTQGTLGGSNASPCGNGALATVDKVRVSWEPHTPPTSAVATYASPFGAADVTKLELVVQYLGDDRTEPLWYWHAKNRNTGLFDLIGDDSWAGNWVSTAHTFTLTNPADYVDAAGNIQIRFTSNTSTNSAELDQMVVRVTGNVPSDASVVDTGVADTGAGDASDAGGPVVDIYDPDLIPTFEIGLDAAAITLFSSTLEADQKTWVHGTFKYGAIEFADVGVRRKGTSTFRVLPGKVALKVKFDKYVKGQTFMGLTDLTLNNQTSDPTYLTERLAYHVFRSAGLPAQKANSARVFINGESFGLYANVETPNKQLIARLFGAKANTLYEQAYGSEWTPGFEEGFEVQVGDGTRSDLTLLFQSVAAARSTSLLADVAPHLDTNEFLDHCAAEAAIGDYDGYAYAIWGSGNYYLAGDTSTVFSLVPWSLDLTFSNREGVVNANAPKLADPVDGGKTLLVRCKASSACWSSYKAHVQAMLVKYESLDLLALAKKWHAQIDAFARTDPKSEYSVSDYDSETAKLYKWITARPGVVRRQLGLPTP